MSLDDTFGSHPGRPAHPDFRILVDLVLQQDATNVGDLDAFLAEAGDPESIRYMAIQRGIRMATVGASNQQLANATCWLDAFMMGVRFARRKDGTS